MRKRAALTVVVLAGWVGACGSGPEPELPPLETVYLPSPETEENPNALSAALCADGSASYERLRAWVELHNEHINDKILLLKALAAAQRRALRTDGEVEWTRERDGRSLTLRAKVEEDGSTSYSATFNGPQVQDFTFLTGTTDADRKSGSWTIYRPVDRQPHVEVSWTRGDDSLTAQRQIVGTDREATYTRVGTTATVEFKGVMHTGTATWDTQTKDGSITIDGTQYCWDFEAGEFCSVTCS